jgi:hypothetical protein
MSVLKPTALIVGAAAVVLAVGQGTLAFAQQPAGDVVGEIANNTGYFVDGKTFKIVKGAAKDSDAAAQFAKLEKQGAKEVGPGVIVFRYNNKLYMLEGSPQPPVQAMKNFQDNWNVSYMKGMKDFQDNFATSYMKDFQSNWNVGYMKDPGAKDADESYVQALKDFQSNWNVSYMKAMKDFQDNWNTSYMKNQQDNWNVSYMKTVKDFQDNWSTSYMK